MEDDTTRERPLSSDEMIARASRRREGASQRLVDQARGRQARSSAQRLVDQARGRQARSSADLIAAARKSAARGPDMAELADLEIALTPPTPASAPAAVARAPRPRRVRRQPTVRPEPFATDTEGRAAGAIVAGIIFLLTMGAVIALIASSPPP